MGKWRALVASYKLVQVSKLLVKNQTERHRQRKELSNNEEEEEEKKELVFGWVGM